jgi:hypothetical protein
MRNILFLLLIPLCICAQQSVDYSFPELKMKFSLYKNFKVTNFMKLDWNSNGGNNACPCAGFIAILQIPSGGGMESIHIAGYPSDKKGSKAVYRNSVWQYEFADPTSDPDTLKENITWVRQKSKFKTRGENRFKEHTVIKLTGSKKETYYTLYYWGKNFILNEKSEWFEEFIKSFDSTD